MAAKNKTNKIKVIFIAINPSVSGKISAIINDEQITPSTKLVVTLMSHKEGVRLSYNCSAGQIAFNIDTDVMIDGGIKLNYLILE